MFDPGVTRKRAFDGAMLKYYLDFGTTSGAAVGHIAGQQLDVIIQAWLVGLSRELAPALSKALEWLDLAIESREQERWGGNPDLHRANLYRARGLAIWMAVGVNASDDFTMEKNARDNYFSNGGADVIGAERSSSEVGPSDSDRIDIAALPVEVLLDDYGDLLGDQVAACYQAGRYEDGVEIFERYLGARKIKLDDVLEPRELGYAMCLYGSRGEFDADALFLAGRKMLKGKLEAQWLGSGGAAKAAMWLKIVHWYRNPELAPLQTILSAYEDMPHVDRPEWV